VCHCGISVGSGLAVTFPERSVLTVDLWRNPACDITPQVTDDGGTMTAASTEAAPGRVATPGPGRAAGAVTGLWAVVLVAALAGAVMTIVARGDLATGDLSSNLGTAAAAAAYATLGALIVRRAGNVFGWIMLGGGATLAFLVVASIYAVIGAATFPGSLPAARQVGALAQSSFAAVVFTIAFMFLLFPTGTLVSPRWLPVAATGLLLAGLTMAGSAVHRGPVTLPAPGGVSVIFPNPLGVEDPGPVLRTLLIGTIVGLEVAVAVFLAAALVSLAVRYRAGGELLRQQVKWLALTAVVFVAGLLIALLGIAADQAWLTTIAYTALELLGLLGIPVAMTVAILKYRLYDIDRIISRTLAYAIVTGLLAGLYAGLVLLAHRVLPLSSPVAVAGATLAAAALFNPLRRRVQQLVDRRFHRARYDADQMVAAFAARLQDAVDLDSVRDDLASVVHQALEPAQVSVWISRHK
jgi:uncharacterized membrane protein